MRKYIVQLYTISYSTMRFIYVLAVQSWLEMTWYSLRVIWRCETTKPMSGDGMQIKFSYTTISQVRITLSPKRPGTPVSSWYGIQAREGVSLYVRIWNRDIINDSRIIFDHSVVALISIKSLHLLSNNNDNKSSGVFYENALICKVHNIYNNYG